MSAPDFLFALELSDERRFEDMLADLSRAVLAHVGYDAAAADELRGTIRAALARGVADGHARCDVRFSAHGGELLVVVAYAGGAEWRTRRPLP